MRWLLAALLCSACVVVARPDVYDPLKTDGSKIETKDFTVIDKPHKRDLPIRVYFPKSTSPAPVILFSHGLGGSSKNNPYLGNHWAGRGYVVVFVQHPGSDESVWKEAPLKDRMAALKKAAGLENFLHRTRDIPAVLDQLERWHADAGHPLGGRLDLKHIGMSGHSFGAVTTQAMSGQTFVLGKGFTDARIKAAVAMSPSVPAAGDAKKAFGSVNIPWLLMTGTADGSPISDMTPKSRQGVFPALPAGSKYELVLEGAEHSAFGDRALPGEKTKRNPNHHRVILALSSAFWDAYLREDAAARAWLDGDAARKVMEKADRWQRK